MRTKIFLLTLCLVGSLTSIKSTAQTTESYNILKLDVLNLMGMGTQKLNLSYETAIFEPNGNNFPTLQLNASIPFNTMTDISINYGAEIGAQLKFYMSHSVPKTQPTGFYLGFRIDGGVVNFDRTRTYMHRNQPDIFREYDFNVNRLRTSMAGTFGMQSKLTKNLYFDAEVGLGFSNINGRSTNVEVDPDFIEAFWMDDDSDVLYNSYEVGKYVTGYFPFSISLGYNF